MSGEDDPEEILSAVDNDASGEDDATSATGISEDDEGDDVEADFDMDARIGHLSRADLAQLPTHEQLQKWHEALLPSEVDLVKELDASNLFFIHVESIIYDMISSKEVAFEEDTQFLRLTYGIEQMLSRIRTSQGKFRLIFFDVSKIFFGAAYTDTVWAFRQAFLIHCQSAGIDHAVFPHWYCDEWRAHVKEWRPTFFLLTGTTVEFPEEEEDEDDEEDEDEKEKKVKLRSFFHALTIRCLSYKTHVAFLRGLQHRGNKIMAFSLEPDCHDVFVDSNAQTSMLALFSAEEEEEDEEEGPDGGEFLKELHAFAKVAGDKVEEDALLRSFLTVRFAKSCLQLVEGQSGPQVALMKAIVKTLLLQEMMLRHIPMDKRAFSTCTSEDWELYSDSISGALENYFRAISKDLGGLAKVEAPEGLSLETRDLFDGRLYRHIFFAVIKIGLADSKGKVDNTSLCFQDWAEGDLMFLWSKVQINSKDKFFPIDVQALKDLEGGIELPALADKLPARTKPELRKTKEGESDILDALDAAIETKNVTLSEADVDHDDEIIWTKPENQRWKQQRIDAVKEAEFMEKGEAEKKMDAKMAAKGKITAYDLAFQKTFAEKRKQLGLKQLSAYANSLTGSSKMHPPIIMKESKESKGSKAEKVDDLAKVGQKQQDLLDKRKAEEEVKIKEHDKVQMKQWDKELDAITDIIDLKKLENHILDLLLGFGRITDSFVGFPAVSSAFKTSEARSKVVVKAIKNIRSALKKMQLDRDTDEDKKAAARRVVRYLISIVQECFNSFGNKDLDAKGIKMLQETLISVRFPQTAAMLFKKWYKWQMDVAEAALAAQVAAKKAEGKDKDKKKGKEKEKDDKKDKKDKKKDKDEEKELGSLEDIQAELEKNQVKKKDAEVIWSGVGDDEFAFQLQEMGQYMTRTVGNAKDEKARVNFRPDKWQRDLLDIVDVDESALIVAPTASGKTFIGYYVMDKVLRADNEGVAVYVAPSKALVNQVSAEIYARFSAKNYPAHAKNELLGVFIKEYNSASGVFEAGKWKNCQVLVTIPHILEMLLLSPTNQDWVKKLRYVVFDEVHCIGNADDALQWEHCLQLIPCPFLALSATVAEPHHFHSWLNRISEKKVQSKVSIVVHTERWNDLYKYIYRDGKLQPLHPFCCIKEQAVKQSGLCTDMTLTPQEMSRLYFAISNVVGKQDCWDRLAPAKYFANHTGFLTKKDARDYEKELKQVFVEMSRSDTLTSDGFSQVQLALQGMTGPGSESFAPPARAVGDGAIAPVTDFAKMSKGTGYMNPDILHKLCRDLDKIDALPAIVFNFSTKQITTMLTKLVKELKDKQHEKYYGTEEAAFKSRKIMEKREREYKAKKEQYEQTLKMKSNTKQAAKSSRVSGDDEAHRGAVSDEKADIDNDVGEAPEPPEDLDEQVDQEFSFHSPKALGQWHTEINEMFAGFKAKRMEAHLVEGLRRGIGMHHEALSKKYRDAVEILFRRGYLRVVFATGTLALGINMPCRTTIFCGDTLELDGLMYRQMSGRAGRRGFDLLGQVVFLDMGFLKISALVSSDLPILAGEFNMSPTTLLRVLNQWEVVSLDEEQGKVLPRSKEDMLRTLAPLFSMPFFRSKADLDTQVAYHTRFTVDFLYREGLLSSNGYTRGLANLSTQLFEIEPANIILARLLSKGLLHDFLIKEKKKVQKDRRETHLTVKLVSVLAWLLYRKRLPPTLPNNDAGPRRKKHLPSKHCPKLPQLPSKILAEVVGYNKSAFEHVQQLAWSVATTRKISEDDLVMPFSGKAFRYGWDPRGEPFDTSSSRLGECIVERIVRYRARSPFAAISGAGDFFDSPHELVSSVRSVLHLDLNSFPSLAMPMYHQEEEEGLEPSNSWMLDFMMHGKMSYLWEDNRINPTKAYKFISEFAESVKKAAAAIKAFSPKEDIVLTTFQALAAETAALLKAGSGSK